MGYGLVDIQTDENDVIIDPRINKDGILHQDFNTIEETYTREAFLKYIPEDADVYTRCAVRDMKYDVDQHIIYDSEFGMPNVLCIIPIGYCARWYQHDNDISYYLAQNSIFPVPSDNPCASWVTELMYPLYPYMDFQDARTGADIENNISYQQIARARQLLIKDNTNEYYTTFADKLNFSGTGIEFLNTFTPMIPNTVKELVKFTKIFNNIETVNQLRPLIYSYWS
jgi:hypothetical protein